MAIKDGKPSSVPQVLPETEEEHWLHQTGSRTRRKPKKGRLKSKEMAEVLTLSKPWSI